MLTPDEIRLLLNALSQETVVEPTKKFPYRVTVDGRGYSKDLKIGKLQAKLSIMLEAACRLGDEVASYKRQTGGGNNV